jgi:hypothetical protein
MENNDEIEVTVTMKENPLKYSFVKSNISHYRQFTKEGKILTMLFLKSNPHGLILDVGYDTFKKKFGRPTLDVSGLTPEQVDEVSELILSYLKINRL